MIQTKEDRELEKRFAELKRIAEEKRKSLPSELKADEVDEGVYYALLYLFLTYKYGAYTDEEYELRANNLKAKYKTRKSMRARQFERYQEEQERYKRSSEVSSLLLTGDLNFKDTFNLLFEYIEKLTNRVIAERLRKRIGYYLVTGAKNLTDEEVAILEKEYVTTKGRERKI